MDNKQGNQDPNASARNILEDLFNSWEQVGYDEASDIVYRKPLTKEAIKLSQQELNKAKALNPDEEWVVNRIKELQDVLDYQRKRTYTGYKFVPIFLILFGGLGLLANLFIGSNPTVDSALKWREKKIVTFEKQKSKTESTIYKIKNKRNEYSHWSDDKRTQEITDKQEYLREGETEINKLKGLSNDDLFGFYQEQHGNNRLFKIVIGTLYMLAGFFYKKAFSVPRYVNEQASVKMGKLEKAGDFLGTLYEKIIFGLMSTPDLKVTTKYKDGTSETKTHNPLFWLGSFLFIFVPVIMLVYYLTLAPLAVAIAYYVNYVRNEY